MVPCPRRGWAPASKTSTEWAMAPPVAARRRHHHWGPRRCRRERWQQRRTRDGDDPGGDDIGDWHRGRRRYRRDNRYRRDGGRQAGDLAADLTARERHGVDVHVGLAGPHVVEDVGRRRR